MIGIFAGLYLVIVTEPDGNMKERYGPVATNDDDLVGCKPGIDESN
jgi:hypothetical protein